MLQTCPEVELRKPSSATRRAKSARQIRREATTFRNSTTAIAKFVPTDSLADLFPYNLDNCYSRYGIKKNVQNEQDQSTQQYIFINNDRNFRRVVV